jgi:HAD superfamily hydrolase (TIGR01509 family)
MSADAVLFDMDGVLVDSERHWVPAEREEILPAVVAGDPPAVGEITGMNYREIYDYVAERYETTLDREAFLALYDETAQEIYGERVSLLPGLPALLDDFAAAGVRTAVVSSSPHDWIDRVLDRFDLRESFDAVVSAEDLDAPGKPAPRIYDHAAGRLGVDPADCLAVEDSEHGVASAVAAGATVVGYRSGADDDLDLSGADIAVADPKTLVRTIRDRTGP